MLISTITVAKYLSCVTATVDQKLTEADSGSSSSSDEHRKHLEKAQNKLLAQQIITISGMKANLSLLHFEPRFGGSFPRKVYEELVDEVQKYVLNSLTRTDGVETDVCTVLLITSLLLRMLVNLFPAGKERELGERAPRHGYTTSRSHIGRLSLVQGH